MSYLKLKKRQKKLNSIFKISAILMTLATFCILYQTQTTININNFRFQLYIISIILLIFSLYIKNFIYILISLILTVSNYAFVNAYANILKNKTVESNNEIKINYQKNLESDFEIIQKEKQTLIIVNMNKKGKEKESLKTIETFINSNNTSVILVGDLGLPLWHPDIKNFMQKTGLKAKNKIIFDNLNPFYIPTINVLAFENIGIKDIIKKNDGYEFILLAK
ncbi:MAG: hypothetical protein R3Y43_00500 [Alphaproteobacteria bacterium]